MAAVDEIGTSSEIKEHYEKTLSFRKRTCAKKKNVVGGGFFYFHPPKAENKGEGRVR